MNQLNKLLSLAGIFFVAGCSMVPASVKGTAEPVSIQQARNAQSSPTVRWGGVIARVENQNNFSIIEVVAKPLSRNTRPREVDASGGRFLAVIPEFIDPVIYTKGREITLIGQLDKVTEGKIGDMNYKFPVVKVTGHHLWKERPEYDDSHLHMMTVWPVHPYHYYYPSVPYHHHPHRKPRRPPIKHKDGVDKKK